MDINKTERQILISALAIAVVIVIAVIVWLGQLQLALVSKTGLLAIAFDVHSHAFPFTIQSFMWCVFAIACGQIIARAWRANQERHACETSILSANNQQLYSTEHINQLRQEIEMSPLAKSLMLYRLLDALVLQLQINKQANNANQILNSNLELMQHELDLKYNLLKYWLWLLPTLGFIGTVIGVANALAQGAKMPEVSDSTGMQLWLANITDELSLAFNTTLLALVLAAVLMLLMHIVQGIEEKALNRAGSYCLNRLINKLLLPPERP
ncbi:MotA/TolQ/ExbB proton channel family protein [Agarivorans sp. Alg241-V36]|uniref:MotA/TolQ/ExbB proton channel family protein n=1 Tax=Agarivorans sp. Alg241-V36 TaxID=2305992 RepID=UPI0013D2EC95|nr:MotA/TolQ/ExbB proton channel family protein [Agarivorans sp. Alg241-V36]